MVRIRALHGHQHAKNARKMNFRNYESVSGIPTHRTEIQNVKLSTFVDARLTVPLLHLMHISLNKSKKQQGQ
jgi:hypothetical protein